MRDFVTNAPRTNDHYLAVDTEADRLLVNVTDSVPVSLWVEASHVRFSV